MVVAPMAYTQIHEAHATVGRNGGGLCSILVLTCRPREDDWWVSNRFLAMDIKS